jgi:cobyrinic acid a,c-diamide synthase
LAKALVIAAPSSGSGKTLVTLGLLRALRNAGHLVTSAKVGPDYIDPQFHAAATGRDCINLDPWAMGRDGCAALLNHHMKNADITLIEGVMGLFDGPEGARGSTADLAADLGLPVVLVLDCAHQAQSVAALVKGFQTFRNDLALAGVFLNRVKSDRHAAILQTALAHVGVPFIGQLRQNDSYHLPSRHLGLVQAQENQGLESLLETVALGVARETTLDRLFEVATEPSNQVPSCAQVLPPLGQSIAVASDEAFRFAYPHMLAGWKDAGAELKLFSPLADEAPDHRCDAVFLPGGYPELHAGKLSSNQIFLDGLRNHRGLIYGECGGYMVLGDALQDADGHCHRMAGLLPLETSFKTRKLHLGYRSLKSLQNHFPAQLRGHEFHYATVTREGDGERLFDASTANGTSLPSMGLKRGNVIGSFAHIISQAP